MPSRYSKEKLMSQEAKTLLLPSVYLAILLVMSAVVLKAGFDRISIQRRNLEKAEVVENSLTEKVVVLEEAEGQISNYIGPLTLALPEKNPSLVLVSQINSLANDKDIRVEELSFGRAAVPTAERENVSLSFLAAGNILEMIGFLKATEKIAPILTLEKVEISGQTAVVAADITLKTYWAGFPETLPPITDPIEKISQRDLKVVEGAVELTPPVFEEFTPAGPYERVNPFN